MYLQEGKNEALKLKSATNLHEYMYELVRGEQQRAHERLDGEAHAAAHQALGVDRYRQAVAQR